mmetsp:Transcript_4625/g.11876  ORF Transcript_4625/g.11876 Transcript_4625/m.11876 type:complete len:281 (-) Transcript_4625:1691-2533(-)
MVARTVRPIPFFPKARLATESESDLRQEMRDPDGDRDDAAEVGGGGSRGAFVGVPRGALGVLGRGGLVRRRRTIGGSFFLGRGGRHRRRRFRAVISDAVVAVQHVVRIDALFDGHQVGEPIGSVDALLEGDALLVPLVVRPGDGAGLGLIALERPPHVRVCVVRSDEARAELAAVHRRVQLGKETRGVIEPEHHHEGRRSVRRGQRHRVRHLRRVSGPTEGEVGVRVGGQEHPRGGFLVLQDPVFWHQDVERVMIQSAVHRPEVEGAVESGGDLFPQLLP